MSDPIRRLETLLSAQREILERSLDSTILISPDMRLILVRSSLWQALGPNRQAQAVVRKAIANRGAGSGDTSLAQSDRLAAEMEAAIALLEADRVEPGSGLSGLSRALDSNGAVRILQRALRIYGTSRGDS